MNFNTISELRDILDTKQMSASELANLALSNAQLHTQQQGTNAYVDIQIEQTLIQAAAADKRLAMGEGGLNQPLLGIPVAHKDVFVTQGWATTACSKVLQNYQSPFDATVVSQLQLAGMVNIGKLNCDEFAMGSSNQSSVFGAVKNPWDAKAISGGSSGGSAAAVASGIIPVATGTDTGGSIRQPASFCGITGIKPTYGRSSRYGMIAYASSLDQAGVLARTAKDCAWVLSAMSGFDEKDSTSINRPVEQYIHHLEQYIAGNGKGLNKVRIGVPKEYFTQGVSSDVLDAVDSAIVQLERMGAVRVNVSLPRTNLSIPAYYVIAPAEASSNLSRFDGVRYGFRAESTRFSDINHLYSQTRANGLGEEVKRRILTGTYVLSSDSYEEYYVKAQKIRYLIAQDFKAAFQHCDIIAGPVAPTVAWNLGETPTDSTHEYLADIFNLGVNLAGLPSMSVPCGMGGLNHNRPIGFQLIGNYFEESRLLSIAHAYQCATDWHQKRPNVL